VGKARTYEGTLEEQPTEPDIGHVSKYVDIYAFNLEYKNTLSCRLMDHLILL
jgi:hypothetical protein